MKTVQFPTSSEQLANRVHIARILKSEDILYGIKVNIDGKLRAQSISWKKYWSPFRAQIPPTVSRLLEALRVARREHIFSGFSLLLARSYCHAYFSLLHRVLRDFESLPDGNHLLHAILGFECAMLRWPDQVLPSAAVTSNVRNPVYLLAKLREPRAYDDPKFLPLNTVWNPSPDRKKKAALYFHYRQIKIAKEEGICLLAYPSVELDRRPDSFACIQNLVSGLSPKKDPRCRRRSELISSSSIGPFFNDSSLLLPSGESVIQRLASLGHLLVIEDVDFRASELLRHLKNHRLHHLAASDSTDRRKMRSSRLLCVCNKESANSLPGKRIW